MYTFGPLIAKNSRSGRLLGGAPVTVTTLDGVTLTTTPTPLVTNHEGYLPAFTVDTDQVAVMARPRGGDPLPLYAHEGIQDAAEAADTINNGRLSEASLTSTFATREDAITGRLVPSGVDLNTFRGAAYEGAWRVPNNTIAASLQNIPVPRTGILWVLGSVGFQLYYVYNAIGALDVYMRGAHTSGEWRTPWRRITTADEAATVLTQAKTYTDERVGSAGGTTPGFDVIVLGGQSNMAGAGLPLNAPGHEPHPRVFQWPAANHATAGTIIPAVEPLRHQGPQGSSAGIGPGLAFARAWAAANPDRRVLLVPAARSASGFSSTSIDPPPAGKYLGHGTWDLDLTADPNNFARNMLTQITTALTTGGPGSRVVAFLWVQGEGDGSLTEQQYATHFDALAAAVRSTAGVPDLPVVVSRMNPDGIELSPTRQTIDKAHIDTPRRLTRAAFNPAPRGLHNPGDTTHFSARAQQLIGEGMFRAWQRATHNMVGVAPLAVEDLAAQRSGNTVRLTWTAPSSRVESYTIEWSTDGTTWNTADITRYHPLDCAATITNASPVTVRVAAVNATGTGARREVSA